MSMRAEGQRRYYRLDVEPLYRISEWLDDFGLASVEPRQSASDPAEADQALVVTEDQLLETGMDPDSMPQQIGRSVGRAATKAADLLANLPKFGRRKD